MKIVADQNIPFVEPCCAHLGQVKLCPGRKITPDLVADADALLVRSVTQVNSALLTGSRVRFVATATIGFEHIDRDYLAQHGIGFSSAPGSNANSVAEYITAALLALGKKHKFHLAGKTIGIVGVGNVGSRVAKKCDAMGMTTVLNDPPLARQTGDPKYRPIDEVFNCDFVTLHTPLTREGQDKTYHLADAAFFARLKKGAFFLNTSRGGVMDTHALKKAMHVKHLAGVVLDVWENEPNIDGDLLARVDLSTPHIAGYSFDGKVAGLMMIYEALCKFFNLKTAHTIADFLPKPQVPEIRLTTDQLKQFEEQIIHDVVQSIYVINRDDFNTREILLQESTKRGEFFDMLRKNYPERREFQNTKVFVPDTRSSLARKLAGIGFQICQG
ncbi:MAG TPA: 4-phosphoerythronate dehydrogenase PdxB [Anaerohalosphaeraceae bacterium]|nr:4-phosphoerythronate dehydrogenase PdxB [Anaerohalosphaeraceae bacterium]